ncbi:MAG: phosphate propanoyltransferase [Treponema sp.]|jgi:putative phosphotransacetylase|nr:phosphate propanoyltransferase [Treponema sp.]
MDETALAQIIRSIILTSLAQKGRRFIPVAVSARHVHVSEEHLKILFGGPLTARNNLSQRGQFASGETVEVSGPKGAFTVRVLGPPRGATQVEVSLTDTFTLGVAAQIRMSGSVAGTPACTLRGPAGTVELREGVIVAARHVHLSPAQACAYGLNDGERIALKVPPPREGILGGFTVRIAEGFDVEAHLDTDEANGSGLTGGVILEMVSGQDFLPAKNPAIAGAASSAAPRGSLDLITERDINNAAAGGLDTVYCTAGGFVSPAAADRAKLKGITIERAGLT